MNRAEVYVDYFKTFYNLADQRCRDYWGTDRPNGQAAGIESLVHFGGMIASSRDLAVIDAGAGASSAIIRTYFKNVVTCDPDAEYLKQVRAACEAMGLGHGEWVHEVPASSCDACFYDYGTHQRKPMFGRFLDLTRNLLWLDDAHDTDLVASVRVDCGKRGLVLQMAPNALDEHGRFGAYVIKG